MGKLRDILKQKSRFVTEKNYFLRAVTIREWRNGMVAGIVLCTVTALIFYNSVRALALGIVIMPCWMLWWGRERQRIKKEEFERQLSAALQALAAALEAGHAFENAMMEVCREQERERQDRSMVGREFKVMAQELAMNIPVETVWEHFALRCTQRDVQELAMVVGAGKRSGGNLIQVMRRCVLQITEKMEVLSEIETMLSARKLELRLMLIMPAAILLYMRFVFGGMMAYLYGSTAGVIVMTVCLCLYAAAAVLGSRIIRTCS